MTKKIVLASGSPRRKELLANIIGNNFLVSPSDVDESIDTKCSPQDFVKQLSARKAEATASKLSNSIVIAADTAVVHNGKILGKPRDKDEAFNMLSSLSDSWHQVMTGLSVIDSDFCKIDQTVVVTDVKFRFLSQEDVENYIKSGEPLDKAGAYGIQGKGALLVERINGCYFNVVGLPIEALSRLLKKFGIDLLLL
ncbi:septum formation inhibitor Maf [Candidatus Poribacteria bacterium]|nr:septum formation inhibitor Maf [Candidatus Poribacteria bacterium]